MMRMYAENLSLLSNLSGYLIKNFMHVYADLASSSEKMWNINAVTNLIMKKLDVGFWNVSEFQFAVIKSKKITT